MSLKESYEPTGKEIVMEMLRPLKDLGTKILQSANDFGTTALYYTLGVTGLTYALPTTSRRLINIDEKSTDEFMGYSPINRLKMAGATVGLAMGLAGNGYLLDNYPDLFAVVGATNTLSLTGEIGRHYYQKTKEKLKSQNQGNGSEI